MPTLIQGKGALQVALAGVTSTSGGGLIAIPNPEGVDLIITRVVVNRTTKSAGAASVDIGVAADATTSSDNLIDGLAFGAAEGVADNITDGGSNGKSRQLWGASQYVTATGGASTAGLVGTLSIEYIRA